MFTNITIEGVAVLLTLIFAISTGIFFTFKFDFEGRFVMGFFIPIYGYLYFFLQWDKFVIFSLVVLLVQGFISGFFTFSGEKGTFPDGFIRGLVPLLGFWYAIRAWSEAGFISDGESGTGKDTPRYA